LTAIGQGCLCFFGLNKPYKFRPLFVFGLNKA
jgi:hypothetical protein